MIVPTTAGRVEGLDHGDHLEFLGIPYADSPYPGHAFAPPRPRTPWSGVRDATSHGASVAHPHVPQHLFPDPVVEGDEPLNLNVYAPPLSGRRHPVLVWIHGGGFVTGTNASSWYTGEAFARSGVVLVVPNYRVASEGFALLDDTGANRGLQDLVTALQWVRDNVERFGGDPDHVTVAGQSSGAMASLDLLGIPAARGLFRRVAAFSPATPLLLPIDDLRATSHAFADALGIPPTRAAFEAADTDRRLERDSSWVALPSPAAGVDDRMRGVVRDTLRWGPVIDGDVVTTSPAQALEAGVDIDALLIGTTTQEWNFFLGALDTPPSRAAACDGLVRLGLDPDHLARHLEHLATDNPGHVVAQALTDQVFRAPARRLADTAARAGVPTYAYQFAWPAPALGAHHCADLPFLFDHLDQPSIRDGLLGPAAPQHLATLLHGALVDFAASGKPGWEPYDTDHRRTMVFAEQPRTLLDGLATAPHRLH